jgi:N-methylhydantoinase A
VVYERSDLPRGWTGEGPLIVEEIDSTVLCGPQDTLSVDEIGNLIIEIGRARE